MTQKIHDKAVNTNPSTIEFLLECYKTQEMCDKAVNRCFQHLFVFLIGMKLKKYVTVVSEDPFMVVY